MLRWWTRQSAQERRVLKGWATIGVVAWVLIELKTATTRSIVPGTLGIPYFSAWILGPLLLGLAAWRGRHLPTYVAIACVAAGLFGELGVRLNGDAIRDSFGAVFVHGYAVEHGGREYSLAYRPVHLTTVKATRPAIEDPGVRRQFDLMLLLIGVQSWLTPVLLLLAFTERFRDRHAGELSTAADWFAFSRRQRLLPRMLLLYGLIWIGTALVALQFVLDQQPGEPPPGMVIRFALDNFGEPLPP